MNKTIYIAPIKKTNNSMATLLGHIVNYHFKGIDKQGNKSYIVYPVSSLFVRLDTVFRNYEKHGYEEEPSYWLVKSDNILEDLCYILEELDTKYPLSSEWLSEPSYFAEKGYKPFQVDFKGGLN